MVEVKSREGTIMGRYRDWDPVVEGRPFPLWPWPDDVTMEEVKELSDAFDEFENEISVVEDMQDWLAPPEVKESNARARQVRVWREQELRRAENSRAKAFRHRVKEIKAREPEDSDKLAIERIMVALKAMEERFAIRKKTPAFRRMMERRGIIRPNDHKPVDVRSHPSPKTAIAKLEQHPKKVAPLADRVHRTV